MWSATVRGRTTTATRPRRAGPGDGLLAPPEATGSGRADGGDGALGHGPGRCGSVHPSRGAAALRGDLAVRRPAVERTGAGGTPRRHRATRPKAATPPQRGWSPRPRSPRSGIGFIAALGAATAGVNTAPNGDVIWAKEPPNQGDPGSAARRIRIVHGAPVDSRRLGAWPSSAQGGCPPKVLTAPGQAPDQVLTPHKTGTPPDSPVADKPSGRLRTFPLD